MFLLPIIEKLNKLTDKAVFEKSVNEFKTGIELLNKH